MDNTFDSLFYNRGELIAGIDESGVSDIAGPLVAACVILPKLTAEAVDLRIFDVNDSKQIPEKYRKQHAEVIWSNALGIGIGEASPIEIDYLGKRKATTLAMIRAIAACQTSSGVPIKPDFILIDGENGLPVKFEQEAIKDADAKSLCVAAASVIAKVYRDEIMMSLHQKFPWYGWNKNKGHPCENQYKGMDEHGIQIGIHRTKFWPFYPNNEKRQDEPVWYVRRGVWRQKTLDSNLLDSGDPSWITSQQSSKEFKPFKKPQVAKKSSENGKASSTS